jgi:hypothetical protein
MSRVNISTTAPSNVNIGHSSRLSYDKCSFIDSLSESVSPLLYKLNPLQVTNCNDCLTTLGPRGSSHGASTFVGNSNTPRLDLVDVESVMTNRNVLASKCKDGNVQDIDLTRFTLQHSRICNDFLNPISSRCTNPASNYRGVSVNRFYNLPKNPQANIFWNFATNTKLEAMDNYREKIPTIIKFDPALPKEFKGNDRCVSVNNVLRCPKRDRVTARSVNF